MRLKLDHLNNILLSLTILAFIFFECFSSMLRYIFNQVGMEFLFYLPKLLIILCIIINLFILFFQKKIKSTSLICLVLLLYVLIISAIYSKYNQAALQLWSSISLFLGFIYAKYYYNNIEQNNNSKIVAAIYIISSTLVILNMFISYPWENLAYNIGDLQVLGSNVGSTSGFTRYIGTFRTSLHASAIIFILMIYLIGSTKKKYLILLYFLLSLSVSIITISKTVIALHTIVIAYLIYQHLNTKIIWFSTIGIYLALSFFTVISSKYSDKINLTNDNVMLLGSIHDRFINTWPRTLQSIETYGNYYLGSGLGLVGAGSTLGNDYNPVDSYFLFILSIGGIFFSSLLVIYLIYIGRFLKKNDTSLHACLVFLVLVSFGFTMNILDYSLMAFALGVLLNFPSSKQNSFT